jgi:hypothetical protein
MIGLCVPQVPLPAVLPHLPPFLAQPGLRLGAAAAVVLVHTQADFGCQTHLFRVCKIVRLLVGTDVAGWAVPAQASRTLRSCRANSRAGLQAKAKAVAAAAGVGGWYGGPRATYRSCLLSWRTGVSPLVTFLSPAKAVTTTSQGHDGPLKGASPSDTPTPAMLRSLQQLLGCPSKPLSQLPRRHSSRSNHTSRPSPALSHPPFSVPSLHSASPTSSLTLPARHPSSI